MEVFNSRDYYADSTLFRGNFKHDIGSGDQKVSDDLITTQSVAKARAKSELLKNGYKERLITIKSIQIQGLKQNDIISFKGENWIVKEISLDYNPPTLTSTIRGLRYE